MCIYSKLYILIPGAHMIIREITTWLIPLAAATWKLKNCENYSLTSEAFIYEVYVKLYLYLDRFVNFTC